MYNVEFVTLTLLLFWIFGSVSVLVDMDHLWKLFGCNEPISFTGREGRPLHDPVIFIFIGWLCSIFAFAFIYGLCTMVPGIFGWMIFVEGLIVLNVLTYIVVWKLGSKLNEMLENDDYDRSKP